MSYIPSQTYQPKHYQYQSNTFSFEVPKTTELYSFYPRMGTVSGNPIYLPTINNRNNSIESIQSWNRSPFFTQYPNLNPNPNPNYNPNDNLKRTIYSPKLLELMDLNQNRYQLAVQNSDLVSDKEINSKLEKMQAIRLDDLNDSNLIIPVIWEIEDCQDVVKRDTKNKKVVQLCEVYKSPMGESDMVKLRRKLEPRLKEPTPLTRAKHEIIVNNLHVIQDDLITEPEYEIDEGAKILEWIETNLVFYGGSKSNYFGRYLFPDLVSVQYRGHIFLARGGLKITDTVGKNIHLKQLKDLYGKPIDREDLVDKLISTDAKWNLSNFTLNPNKNKDPKEEIKEDALKILSEEYFICLQPEPRYMLYALKRLIIAWYADTDLSSSISKIRLLINQYRARRDVPYQDSLLGTLPSILIYLRYGSTNANRALNKINYYFTNYVNIGWLGNDPDYFIKYNNLIYYSNGSPDVKRMIDNLAPQERSFIYKPLTSNPSGVLLYGEEIVPAYPQPDNKLNRLEYVSRFKIEEDINETAPLTKK